MSDTTITSEPSQDVSSGTTVTTGAGQSVGAGDVDPNTGQTPEPAGAGTSQERTEDGTQEPSQKRSWSKVDEIKELRAWRREARQRESELMSRLEETNRQLEDLRYQNSQPRDGRAARNPANFWQDPEAVLEAKLEEKVARLQDAILGEFHNVRETDQANSVLRQEQGSAVEFIRSQKSYSPEDDEELIQIIEENGLSSLAPMQAARAAWSILQQDRGVTDNSVAKARASTVVGQPPGAGFGRKIWSVAEYDRTLDNLMKNPMKMTPELETELMSAAREGRVR